MFSSIYKNLNLKSELKRSEVEDLLEVPKKEKKTAKIRAFKEDAAHEADLLFLPEDDGYKYVLSVVDEATREADAEALKDKRPETVLKAIKKIWKRKKLNRPTIYLKVDSGTEFKGDFKKYFKDNGIILNAGKTNRHRSVALAEYLNFVIGKSIGALKISNESKYDDNIKWKKHLKTIIKGYNDYQKTKNWSKYKMFFNKISSDVSKFKKGDFVRIALDYPIDKNGKKIDSKFRAGDIRWTKKKYKVKDVLRINGQPLLYLIEGKKAVAYTKEQLKLYNSKSQKLKPSEEKFIIEEIKDKKKINNKVHYKVKWKNYSKTSWEPRTNIKNLDPVKLYEKKLKEKKDNNII